MDALVMILSTGRPARLRVVLNVEEGFYLIKSVKMNVKNGRKNTRVRDTTALRVSKLVTKGLRMRVVIITLLHTACRMSSEAVTLCAAGHVF